MLLLAEQRYCGYVVYNSNACRVWPSSLVVSLLTSVSHDNLQDSLPFGW